MTAPHILILLAVGAGAGFASGLLGVGGGFIMVPVSYWVMLSMGVADKLAFMTAIGTSFLVMLPTAVSGTLGHNKNGAIHWRAALILGGCGLAGAPIGAHLADILSATFLKAAFGGLVLAVALWMGLGLVPRLEKKGQKLRDNSGILVACGLPIGVVTGLTGLGGGVLKVPVLVLALHIPMHIAVGTSVASIMLTSVGGIFGYILNGLGMPDLLPYSIGYVNLLPVGLCLVATSIPLARLGVRAAHALPGNQLKYILIAFLVYTGLRMIGVF